MTRYVFEEVSTQASKSGKCTGCGKSMRRQKTFTNTINPFNKNPDGTIRNRSQVRENVQKLAKEWESQPLVHEKCEAES